MKQKVTIYRTTEMGLGVGRANERKRILKLIDEVLGSDYIKEVRR